ncbi:TonB-linked SusC/RagA family outer membrane protein [Gillisia sp. Hel_I_86]|uniref:SusC/RagA family TonB-linked outer membrane protein n=1 Tax=Gillisia sp. Hel_I_86 TaxID=1249981 RepID=UPI00119B02C1|nr:SusC/RagA family TonB-linked outer membrane protein [Gillisia sp. Hel_I_86]TVZ25858.1 TonB-linked SusC/RagA family outer membrane protein [Gillisia sp. Hel_I_86]
MNLKTLSSLIAFLAFLTGAAQSTFTGTVFDENNFPLPGASVIIKGTSVGTMTDFDGNFSIEIPGDGEILIISFLGYKPYELDTSNKTQATINLIMDSDQLDEIVITALGIKKDKKKLGYSVQEVKGDITKARDPNFLNSLSGKVAGLVIAQSPEFFKSPNISLRGKNPLLVVDGVPLGTDSYNISPDDIENITVLKGANAGALYGANGANGAIQITTKRGTENDRGVVIEWNNSSMLQSGFNAVPEVQHSYGPGSYGNYAFVDGKGGGINDADYDQWGPKFDGQLIPQYDSPLDAEGNRIPTPWLARGVDNFKNFMEVGFLETNNLTLASSSDAGSIRFSPSHTFQKGINPNTRLNIFNYNLSGVYNFNENTTVNGYANFNFQTSPNNPNVQYGPNSYIYNMLIWGGSDWDVRDLRDYWQEGKEGLQQKNFEYTRYNNPYFMAYEWLRGYYSNDYSGQLSLTHRFNKHVNLVLRSNIAVNNLFQDEKFPYSATTYGREKAQGDYKERYNYSMKNYSDAMLNYNDSFGDFAIDGLLGANLDINKTRSTYAATDYLIVPGLYNLSNSQTPTQPNNYKTHYETYSLYGAADLAYKNYLFLGVTGRYEKDSRLPEKNNAFFYPSVSLSAVLSSMMELPEQINFLKLRGSYAKVGTSLTNIYSNLDTYNLGSSYTISGKTYNPAYVNTILSNPNLEPAYNSSTEVGLETDLFENRLGLNMTYFENKNGPRIFNLNYSLASGYTGKKQNGITTKTKGWEISLNLVPVQKENFNWKVGLNWSTYKEFLDKVYTDPETKEEITNYGRINVGDRFDPYYVNDFMRSGDGQLIVGDDGKPIMDNYPSLIGYRTPDWAAGLTNSINYKNLALNFTFDGRYGGKIENYVNRKLWQSGRHPDSDTPERANDVQGIKSFVAPGVVVTGGELVRDGEGNIISDTRIYTPNTTEVYYQDYAKAYHGREAANIIDKTFFKLREIALTYNLPGNILENSFINQASVSLIGRDLLYFSKHKNIDLDQFIDEGSSPLQTPTVKSYGINFNVKF